MSPRPSAAACRTSPPSFSRALGRRRYGCSLSGQCTGHDGYHERPRPGFGRGARRSAHHGPGQAPRHRRGAYCDGGHQITVVSRRYDDFAEDEVVEGLRHLRIASSDRRSSLLGNLGLDLRYSLRVAKAVPPADITITNGFFLPLVLPRRRAGKIYVQIGRYPKGQMALYSRADRLQAVSKAVGRAVARQAPWLLRKIRVIGYAIADFFRRGCQGSARARGALCRPHRPGKRH